MLGPSSSSRGETVNFPVPIIDDQIDETKETYVGVLRLVSAVNPETIIYKTNVTQLIINDNDSKCVFYKYIHMYIHPLYSINNSRCACAPRVKKWVCTLGLYSTYIIITETPSCSSLNSSYIAIISTVYFNS